MSEGKPEKKRFQYLLIIFIVLVPIAMWIGREFAFGKLIGYMRAQDAADIAILSPIYLAIILYLGYYVHKHQAPWALVITFIVFGFVFMYGQSMHATANTINTFATEVRDYKEILPKDLYALIFFLDERLSHFILFLGITGLIGCWLVFDQLAIAPPIFPKVPLLIVGIGILFGVVMSYAIIEARMVWILFPIELILGGMWLWFWRRSGLSLRKFLGYRPFTTFVAILLVTTILAMLIWGLYFGGYPQPSEMGL
ncbi:hypothetical protein ACFLUA_05240 [Chloroflexota bacterium]